MATILDVKVGDTIKVSGIHFYESLNRTAVTCGKITSESPVIKILSLEYKKHFKCNPYFIIGTENGKIEIVTRQKIEIL